MAGDRFDKDGNEKLPTPIQYCFLAGGVAGGIVDSILYPLDTLKTRLQSNLSFKSSGGPHNLYRGIAPALLGSIPSAALFFSSYETVKRMSRYFNAEKEFAPGTLFMASAFGEIMACTIRAPVEVLKQRMQINRYSSTFEAFRGIYLQDGLLGFQRGYWALLRREIPFSCIQFPLYEFFKIKFTGQSPWESAICGSLSGAIAAAITTPLDVLKTRVIVTQGHKWHVYQGVWDGIRELIKEPRGWKTAFSGVGPRVAWIGMGGFIFFGVYEKVCKIFEPDLFYRFWE